MFVQLFRGPIRSGADALAMLERWMDDLREGAEGWLGGTAGVTPDGQFVALIRFASAAQARRNSDRPEQGAWWAEMEQQFTGPVTFHDCDDVAQLLDGGRDDAGFVQVIEASSTDPVPAADLAAAASQVVAAHRPDVLGGLVAVADDGTVVQAVYFTSEAEAREYERRDLPPDAAAEMDALMARLGEPAYFDLPRPLLLS